MQVALAGALPLQGIGVLLVLSSTNGGIGDIAIESAMVNEGHTTVAVDETLFDDDSDGDGMTDWMEIRAGTDPRDRSSVFALKSFTLNSDGSRVLTWSSVPGKRYCLLFQDEVVAPNWLPLGGEITATGSVSSGKDTAALGASTRLYRVRLLE